MRTRPQFWIAFWTTLIASGTWKVVDASTNIIDRLARIETEVATLQHDVDAIAQRDHGRSRP